MNSLLNNYKEMQEELKAYNGMLEFLQMNDDIILHLSPGAGIIGLYCLNGLYLLLFYAGLASHYPTYKVVLCAILIGIILWKIGWLRWTPYCPPMIKIDSKTSELIVYPFRKPEIKLSIDTIDCFLGSFFFVADTMSGHNIRNLYAVTNDGTIYRLNTDKPSIEEGGLLIKALSHICQKPYYLSKKGMGLSQFTTEVSGNQKFDAKKFLDTYNKYSGEKLLKPLDASILPNNKLLDSSSNLLEPSPEQRLHSSEKDDEHVN